MMSAAVETGLAVLEPSTSYRDWARSQPEPRRATPMSERALAWCGGLILALMAGTLLFTRLDYPLLEPDESRYALIPLHMLQDGDWIVPHLQGKPYNDKPPLTYWLTALCYRLCGV